jgi:DNA polymerase III delta prime subunit
MQTPTTNNLWTEKYRPNTLNEYYIAKDQLDRVKEWITEFKTISEVTKPFLILYGTPGIGKTTLAHLIFNKFGYEIIECNASDTRTKKHIKEMIGGISTYSICLDNKNKFKPTGIIMDEIDGLLGSENYGVQELVDTVVIRDKQTKEVKTVCCPVICTTNSIKEKKLQPLLRLGVLINIKKPSDNDCIKLINKIAKAENFVILDSKKREIIETANGDYRQIIMLLYSYYNDLKKSVQLANINSMLDENNSNNINDSNNPNIKINTNMVKDIVKTVYQEEDEAYCKLVREINNFGETPLDKINYFLSHSVNQDIISYFCSGDSNLFFMNFYNNIISIIAAIQNKQPKEKSKEYLLKYYKVLEKIYKCVSEGDLMNNSIFVDKNWDLLDHFDFMSIGYPCKILYDFNIKPAITPNTVSKSNPVSNPVSNLIKNDVNSLYVNEFVLTHHTQYNFMRQEQVTTKKKLNIDYLETFDNDMINIFYNLKRFQAENEQANTTITKTKKLKNLSSDEQKYNIDRSYIKYLEKIDELLK